MNPVVAKKTSSPVKAAINSQTPPSTEIRSVTFSPARPTEATATVATEQNVAPVIT